MVSYSKELASELGGEGFRIPGYNGKILMIGEIDNWYECHYCGNATQHRPRFCPKCYGISGIKYVKSKFNRILSFMNSCGTSD